ncbi:Hypothetical protein NTJ_11572 [Nesidiocoris tenuis]|uniref:Uncharacterized protein n=1 Tax=Nesidiocoris tenuis TaxID=355587 RepID=A0ABN7B2W0_9HEMI|nr:Hypothetical protein NTJ_11572 [Nesidiocoris tenuis]
MAGTDVIVIHHNMRRSYDRDCGIQNPNESSFRLGFPSRLQKNSPTRANYAKKRRTETENPPFPENPSARETGEEVGHHLETEDEDQY